MHKGSLSGFLFPIKTFLGLSLKKIIVNVTVFVFDDIRKMPILTIKATPKQSLMVSWLTDWISHEPVIPTTYKHYFLFGGIDDCVLCIRMSEYQNLQEYIGFLFLPEESVGLTLRII